jgi:hypothetical protein
VNMDDYIWRVANIFGNNCDFHLERLLVLEQVLQNRNQLPNGEFDGSRQLLERYRRFQNPSVQSDGWPEHIQLRADDRVENELMSIEEMMDESIGNLCITALCLLLYYA